MKSGMGRIGVYVLLADPDCFALTFRPKKSINEHFGAILGDAVNNLREALDYWMNNAVRCVGPSQKGPLSLCGRTEKP